MTKNSMRTGPFEVHDPDRQALLMDRARSRCVEIVAEVSPRMVLASGSVVRGPVTNGSDLDLHVIAEETAKRTPVWHFCQDGIIENVHTVPATLVDSGIASSADSAAAIWFQETNLGDELSGSEPMYIHPGAEVMATNLKLLLSRRTTAPIAGLVARAHAGAAIVLVQQSISALTLGCPLEAHQVLRRASQCLLVASLVAVGWMIRGSKKRPEIASLYTEAAAVRNALQLLAEINGLTDLTPGRARALCAARLAIREATGKELRRLFGAASDSGEELLAQVRHDANAIDYYAPLIAAGCCMGPVNHIRALSGFKDLPGRVLRCLGHPETTVDAFLGATAVSGDYRDAWYRIAGLEAGNRLGVWQRRLSEQAGHLTNERGGPQCKG